MKKMILPAEKAKITQDEVCQDGIGGMPNQAFFRLGDLRTWLFLFRITVVLPGVLAAQAIHPPVLHHRNEPENGQQTIMEVHGQPVLSDDASGEYNLGQPGEVVQIILEQQGHLTGYISTLGDHDSDRGTPLTFMFHHTSTSGEQIQFSTGTVHGVWYGFHGSILRGAAKSRSEDGYYHLTGVLEEHDEAGGTVQRRNVDLKLSRSLS